MPTVPQAGLWTQLLNNCLWKEWFLDSAVPWIPDTAGTAEDLRDHRIQCQRSGWRDAPLLTWQAMFLPQKPLWEGANEGAARISSLHGSCQWLPIEVK